MLVKDIVDTDFVNYKKPSMFIIFPFCSFKCDKENGNQYCQNWSLTKQPNIDINHTDLIKRYLNNPLSEAFVCGGLEPFDSWTDLFSLVYYFRKIRDDDIVIYTGYTEEEIADKIELLKHYPNIIIKFGRYRPNQKPHYDEILGVNLASDNQYAKRIN